MSNDKKWTDEDMMSFAEQALKEASAMFAGRKAAVDSLADFKASKQPKKEWEVVEVYCDGGDPVPAYLPAGWTKGWVAEQIKTSGLKIHSIRRLPDNTTWVIDEKVEVFEMGYVIIKGFEIRDSQVYVITDDGTYLLKDLRKLPATVLTTTDGKEMKEGDKVWIIDKDEWRVLDAPQTVYASTNFAEHPLFSTRQAAEDYLVNHRPVLSLNDVREVCKHLYSNSKDIVLANAAALVKQKLNS
jgi:hypothetical protein